MTPLEDFLAAASGAEDDDNLAGTSGSTVTIPAGAVVWGRVIVTRPQYILVQVRAQSSAKRSQPRLQYAQRAVSASASTGG